MSFPTQESVEKPCALCLTRGLLRRVGLFHTAKPLDAAHAGISGSLRLALGIKVSGGAFLTADVSRVLARGVRAEVLRNEEVVLPTAPSEWDAWAALCLDSSTQRVQRSLVQRDVCPLVVEMLRGMRSGGGTHHLNCLVRLGSQQGSDVRLVSGQFVEGEFADVSICRACMVVEASAVLQMGLSPAHQRAGAKNFAQSPAALCGEWVSIGMSPVSHFCFIGGDVCVFERKVVEGRHP